MPFTSAATDCDRLAETLGHAVAIASQSPQDAPASVEARAVPDMPGVVRYVITGSRAAVAFAIIHLRDSVDGAFGRRYGWAHFREPERDGDRYIATGLVFEDVVGAFVPAGGAR